MNDMTQAALTSKDDNHTSTYVSKIEVKDLLSFVSTKQTQYYTLWGFYTAVEFSAGSFGFSYNDGHLTMKLAMAAVTAVWIFNLGHLSFVLQCARQINRCKIALNQMLDDKQSTPDVLKSSLRNAGDVGYSLPLYHEYDSLTSLFLNSFVHLSIDMCATVAIIIRIT